MVERGARLTFAAEWGGKNIVANKLRFGSTKFFMKLHICVGLLEKGLRQILLI